MQRIRGKSKKLRLNEKLHPEIRLFLENTVGNLSNWSSENNCTLTILDIPVNLHQEIIKDLR